MIGLGPVPRATGGLELVDACFLVESRISKAVHIYTSTWGEGEESRPIA